MSTYETSKTAIKNGGYAFFTMGILLFGDPGSISLTVVVVKGFAVLITGCATGFVTGFSNKLGGSLGEHVSEKWFPKKTNKKIKK